MFYIDQVKNNKHYAKIRISLLLLELPMNQEVSFLLNSPSFLQGIRKVQPSRFLIVL